MPADYALATTRSVSNCSSISSPADGNDALGNQIIHPTPVVGHRDHRGLGDRGIRPIEDAWAAVAFRDPGSVHADRTVVTQAAREMEICASH